MALHGTMMRSLTWLCGLLFLAGCGAGDTGFVRLGDYECDAGEAVVRHLIKTMPDVSGGVPKEFCLIKALDQRATDADFTKRFADMNVTFVSRDVVVEQEETHYPINPKSGLSPHLVQLRTMRKLPDGAYEVEGAWAYKRNVQRKLLRVAPPSNGKAWIVTEIKVLESVVNAPVK